MLAVVVVFAAVASHLAFPAAGDGGLLRGSFTNATLPTQAEDLLDFLDEPSHEETDADWLSSAGRRLFFGLCDAGYEGSPFFGQCQKCEGGDTRRRRSTECSRCGTSYYDRGDYDDACTECPKGATRRRRSSTSCTSCPPGRFSNINMDDCRRCVGGEVVSASFEPRGSKCEQCNRGYYDAGDFQQCQPAPESLPGPCAVDSTGKCVNQQQFVPKWLGNGVGTGTMWTVISNCSGTEQTWILFGDLDEVSSSFVGADYADTLWPSRGLATGDSVQVGSFYAGVPGSPGYSFDVQTLLNVEGTDSSKKFDLMIQYGKDNVYEKCISGFSQTYRDTPNGEGEYVILNNQQALAATPGTIGEHGMFGAVTDQIDGYYATFCAVNGGCATAGADFWQFSTNGVYPGYHSEVPCGFTLFEDWKLCRQGLTRLGDNSRRMRYYIRADHIMQRIAESN